MFIINREKNEAISLERKTFHELRFKERKNLQEWIEKNTYILGEEDLLIIQKEFSDFDNTKERLDLLALDKDGNLVIIENKLDDSGRDVVWQALKYASYCASFTKEDIRRIFQDYIGSKKNAEEILVNFFDVEDFEELQLNTNDQRIILVAANFRKEVTSTVLWLIEHGVNIKCIKVTPYKYGDNIFLDTEQIIPIKDAEEYLIKIRHKNDEQIKDGNSLKKRHKIRLEFWEKLLEEMNKKSNLFENVSPSKDSWIAHGSGYGGITYEFGVSKKYAKVYLWINVGDKEKNKKIFDELYNYKDEIEKNLNRKLYWERMDYGKGCRISNMLENVNVYEKDDWNKMINFLTESMINFEKVMKVYLNKVMNKN
jgi:hypothetical protein